MQPQDTHPADALARGFGRRGASEPNLFSTAGSFQTDLGSFVTPGELGGYHLDFRFKAHDPSFPPHWMPEREELLHVATAQWGLGCYERHLAGEGEAWLRAALDCADFLMADQQTGGHLDGGWLHEMKMPHTYVIPRPWLSGMAQGEGASLMVRAHAATGEDRYADAALRALAPLDVPVADGGVLADLNGGPFYEEYPTDPASYVLNGAIFTIWGCYDVAIALGDDEARRRFDDSSAALAAGIGRWDLGSWSAYDLYPHPVVNIASAAYHGLHISQLRAMIRIDPRPEYLTALERFEGYVASRSCRVRAFARKIAFRLLVPRNALLAHRLPWS